MYLLIRLSVANVKTLESLLSNNHPRYQSSVLGISRLGVDRRKLETGEWGSFLVTDSSALTLSSNGATGRLEMLVNHLGADMVVMMAVVVVTQGSGVY